MRTGDGARRLAPVRGSRERAGRAGCARGDRVGPPDGSGVSAGCFHAAGDDPPVQDVRQGSSAAVLDRQRRHRHRAHRLAARRRRRRRIRAPRWHRSRQSAAVDESLGIHRGGRRRRRRLHPRADDRRRRSDVQRGGFQLRPAAGCGRFSRDPGPCRAWRGDLADGARQHAVRSDRARRGRGARTHSSRDCCCSQPGHAAAVGRAPGFPHRGCRAHRSRGHAE